MMNIAYIPDSNKTVIVGKTYLSIKPYCEDPINSNILNIYLVEDWLNELIVIFLNQIKYKVILFDISEAKKITFPIMHTGSTSNLWL